tara:strand:- start:457 stop:1092 length:636 start_codon:yes stop_codon:yes gene_type:complete
MAQQDIVIGAANQGNGDTLFDAFTKVQANFTELYIDDTGDVNSVTAGTGISVNQTTGAVVVTNSDPDQTVSLTDGGDIAVSGTYPSFTLTNSAPNYNHTGDVTGATALTIADDVITYAKLGTEFTTSAALSTNVDFSTAQVFTKTLTADATLTFSNTQIGMVKDLVITGAFVLTLPAGSTVAGTYNGAVSNLIQVVVTGATTYWFSISQAI